MSDIERDLIGRDLRERSLYCKTYAVASYEGIQKLSRYIQDYREYLTQNDLHYTMIYLVEIGQVNIVVGRLKAP